MVRKNSRLSKRRGWSLAKYKWLLAALLLAVIMLGVLEWRGTIHLFTKNTSLTSIPSQPRTDSPNPTKDTTSDVPGSTAPTPESPKQDQPKPPSGDPPITPYGGFVSNHHPNLSGKPAPATVVSVCNTTPGAMCYIEFTSSSGVVKKLDAQTTDGNGGTYWSWDIRDAGLTAGSWSIKAIAMLNNQTATAKDVQNLEVEP